MKLPSTPAAPPLQSIWVSANSLATRLETTPSTIWRWAKSGRIPAPTKIGPGTTRWRLDEVMCALETNGMEGR